MAQFMAAMPSPHFSGPGGRPFPITPKPIKGQLARGFCADSWGSPMPPQQQPPPPPPVRPVPTAHNVDAIYAAIGLMDIQSHAKSADGNYNSMYCTWTNSQENQELQQKADGGKAQATPEANAALGGEGQGVEDVNEDSAANEDGALESPSAHMENAHVSKDDCEGADEDGDDESRQKNDFYCEAGDKRKAGQAKPTFDLNQAATSWCKEQEPMQPVLLMTQSSSTEKGVGSAEHAADVAAVRELLTSVVNSPILLSTVASAWRVCNQRKEQLGSPSQQLSHSEGVASNGSLTLGQGTGVVPTRSNLTSPDIGSIFCLDQEFAQHLRLLFYLRSAVECNGQTAAGLQGLETLAQTTIQGKTHGKETPTGQKHVKIVSEVAEPERKKQRIYHQKDKGSKGTKQKQVEVAQIHPHPEHDHQQESDDGSAVEDSERGDTPVPTPAHAVRNGVNVANGLAGLQLSTAAALWRGGNVTLSESPRAGAMPGGHDHSRRPAWLEASAITEVNTSCHRSEVVHGQGDVVGGGDVSQPTAGGPSDKNALDGHGKAPEERPKRRRRPGYKVMLQKEQEMEESPRCPTIEKSPLQGVGNGSKVRGAGPVNEAKFPIAGGKAQDCAVDQQQAPQDGTAQDNGSNGRSVAGSVGYKFRGITLVRDRGVWKAKIGAPGGKARHLCYAKDPAVAARAYDRAVVLYRPDSTPASLNFPHLLGEYERNVARVRESEPYAGEEELVMLLRSLARAEGAT